MDSTTDLKGRIGYLRDTLEQAFTEAGDNYDFAAVTILGDGDTKAKLEKIEQFQAELKDLHGQVKQAEAAKREVASYGELDRVPLPNAGREQPQAQTRQTKSIGQMFVESKAFTGYTGGGSTGPATTFDIDLGATLFQTSAGWAPESLRTGHVEYLPTRPAPHVSTYWTEYATSQAVVKYMEETTFTNAAAETAEAGAYPAATLVLTERSQTVRKIAVFLPVTDEQLEDETEVRSYVDNRLQFMLQQRLDSQLLVGDGTGVTLTGTENVSGIQTQALGTDPIFDASFKLFRQIRDNGFAEPSVAFVAPSRWQTVALTRTSDGLYILGNPANAPTPSLWGVPVVQTVAGTATKLTAGDYQNFSGLYVRRGIDLQVGYNNDDFTKGQLSIRADVRVAAVHFRPKAFGTVTGL
jgi:HK97 family phage major capsid protein